MPNEVEVPVNDLKEAIMRDVNLLVEDLGLSSAHVFAMNRNMWHLRPQDEDAELHVSLDEHGSVKVWGRTKPGDTIREFIPGQQDVIRGGVYRSGYAILCEEEK